MWVALTVTDEPTDYLSSGYPEDSTHPSTGEIEPDGLLHDEDLLHRSYNIDPDTLGGDIGVGPDADQRPDGVNLGLVYFNNDFEFIDPETGETSIVLTPSTPITSTTTVPFRPSKPVRRRRHPIDLNDINGNVTVGPSYRAIFPPKFLRLLNHAPDLVTEEMVDNNTIVTMETASLVIRNTSIGQ